MRVIVLLLLTATLAGCSEAPPAEEPQAQKECIDGFCGDSVESADGRDLRTELTADDRVPAPEWQVGDVFEQHMFFGKDDSEGMHIQTMVVDVLPQGYQIATSNEEAARLEAVYDYPVLGRIGKGLETEAFGADWSWMYQFPLGDGDTWQGSLEELINWNSYNFSDFDLTLTSTYDPAIDTPHGDYPGFWIEGTTQDGDVLARYNYVPAIGWFSHFWLYDWDTPDPDDIMFHAMSMGTWDNYTDTYYVAQAETVIEDFWGFFPDPGNPGNAVQGEPGPRDFSVPERDRVMGIAVPIAVGGRAQIDVTEPDAQKTSYQYQQLDLEGPGFDVFFIDQEAEAGDWQAEFVTAGAFTGAFLWLSAVTVQEYTMA